MKSAARVANLVSATRLRRREEGGSQTCVSLRWACGRGARPVALFRGSQRAQVLSLQNAEAAAGRTGSKQEQVCRSAPGPLDVSRG